MVSKVLHLLDLLTWRAVFIDFAYRFPNLARNRNIEILGDLCPPPPWLRCAERVVETFSTFSKATANFRDRCYHLSSEPFRSTSLRCNIRPLLVPSCKDQLLDLVVSVAKPG